MRIPAHVAAAALARLREIGPGGRYEHLVRAPGPGRGRSRVIDTPAILRAEPISTAIGLSALISAGLGVSAAAGAAIGGFIVGTTISFGLSYAARALAGTPDSAVAAAASVASAGINDPSVSHNTRQANPSKRIGYGTTRAGGALFFEKVVPPYLYHGLLMFARQISAFRGVYIGSNLVPFAAFTPGAILTPLGDTTLPAYQTRLRVSLALGTAAQTIDPLLAGAFTSLDTNFRQRGIVRAVLRYDYGADYDEFQALWGSVQYPSPNFVTDNSPIYDPRDPTQDRDDDTTWAFSNNAALVQADYLRQSYGGRISSDRIDWDRVATAAEYDDSLVGCLDGTFIRRHSIDGVIALNQSPADVMLSMLSANRGFVHESGGTVWVSSSRPRDPVATIYDKLLTGALEFRAAQPKRQVLNRVRSRFVSEDREYQQADGPILDRADLQADDAELLEATLNLPFTRDYRRAERLQKAHLDSSRIGKTITCRCDVRLLAESTDELVGAAIRFDSVLFSQANGIYFVRTLSFADNFASVELSMTEYDSTIETDWHPETDEAAFTVATLNLS